MSKKQNILVVLTSLFVTLLFAQKGNKDMVYEVNYIADSLPRIEVAFNWKSDSQGYLKLKYENESWGDVDIYDCITDLNVYPSPESIQIDRDSSLIVIKVRPDFAHTIKYAIVQDFKEPLKNHHRYRPLINETYFHLLGMRLFMTPTDLFPEEEAKARVRVSWLDMPEGRLFHSSFGADLEQELWVTREELYSSFFVGGDFRRYTFTYQDKPVYFLTRGNWVSLDEEEVLEILKEVIVSQHRFWKAPMGDRYSVTLIPTTEKEGYSIGGSGLTDSFISFASNNPEITLTLMDWLYNHELLHKWMGRTIKNENEVAQYWFSEGFTDYYAYKLMLRNDRIDFSAYIDLFNLEIITPHYANPNGVSTTPNDDLTFETYWSQYRVYGKLPYRRGCLYAFYLDNQIKRHSNGTKSLDDLMRDLLERSESDPEFRLHEATFLEALSVYEIPGYKDQYERYINKGELIDFQEGLPKGLRFQREPDNFRFIVEGDSQHKVRDEFIK